MRQEARMLILAAVCLTVGAACGRRTPPPAPAPAANGATTSRPTSDPNADARARAEEEARRRAEEPARARATLANLVFFDYDRSDLRADARTTLDAKLPILRANPTVRLRIEGHADERGSVEYNLALGLRRANAARQYLSGFNIDAGRIEVLSYGEERPLERMSNEQAWARNRRAEFNIVAGEIAVLP